MNDAREIACMTLGPISTNCYIIANHALKEAVIIDPADRADLILARCRRMEVRPAAVLLTHGHFDHIGAAAGIKREEGVPVCAAQGEKELLLSPEQNLSAYQADGPIALEPDILLKEGQELAYAGTSLKVLMTPGHTPGGCCFYGRELGIVFCGDTLFQGSVGRTDFPGGSMKALLDSIRRALLPLPDETVVAPGHGGVSTIGEEKKTNPWIRDAAL